MSCVGRRGPARLRSAGRSGTPYARMPAGWKSRGCLCEMGISHERDLGETASTAGGRRNSGAQAALGFRTHALASGMGVPGSCARDRNLARGAARRVHGEPGVALRSTSNMRAAAKMAKRSISCFLAFAGGHSTIWSARRRSLSSTVCVAPPWLIGLACSCCGDTFSSPSHSSTCGVPRSVRLQRNSRQCSASAKARHA